jgi:hypothetical protein
MNLNVFETLEKWQMKLLVLLSMQADCIGHDMIKKNRYVGLYPLGGLKK